MANPLTEFGERLSTIRKATGMSQSDLACQINASRGTLSNWERGESQPSYLDLLELCSVLKTTAEVLFGQQRPNGIG